jgi:phosphate transport system protein
MATAHKGSMKKPHAEPAYDADLARIRRLTAGMGSRAEQMLADSLKALVDGDAIAARKVAARDGEINALEMEIDERCLALLARWQPVASDLRLVGATLKLVTDLERVGDQCANICERVADAGAGGAELPADLYVLTTAVPALLRDALVAWRAEDVELAAPVIERGRLIGALVHEIVRGCFELSRRAPTGVAAAIRWHQVVGCLERIGGHATNVAELVIFLVRGEDVRHQGPLPVVDRGVT